MEKNIVLFILTFLVLFIVYEFMILSDNRKRKSKKANNKGLVELKLLKYCFKVPVEKLKYGKLLQVIALVSSIDIALIVTIACAITDMGILQILVSMIVLLPIIFGSYYLVAFIYLRSLEKGKKKNE